MGCSTEQQIVREEPPRYAAYGPALQSPPAPPLQSPAEYPSRPYPTGPHASPPAYPDNSASYRDQAPPVDAGQADASLPTVASTRDFEEPLASYGRWLDTPEYGRVWQPSDQPAGWRPYGSDGQWIYTSYGWTWSSYQPWGWACFHYGNWFYRPSCGWVWIPGTVWAPAWVEWRECDGYVAWAPCPPPRCPRYFASAEYCDSGIRFSDFVVVERQHFCKPIGNPVIVAPVHNVTIIQKTRIINKVKVVNRIARNEGPERTRIEQATREKVRIHNVGEVLRTEPLVRERKAPQADPVRSLRITENHVDIAKSVKKSDTGRPAYNPQRPVESSRVYKTESPEPARQVLEKPRGEVRNQRDGSTFEGAGIPAGNSNRAGEKVTKEYRRDQRQRSEPVIAATPPVAPSDKTGNKRPEYNRAGYATELGSATSYDSARDRRDGKADKKTRKNENTSIWTD